MKTTRNAAAKLAIASNQRPLTCARLWMLRLLASMGCHRRLVHDHGFPDDLIVHALGRPDWLSSDPKKATFDAAAIRAEMRHMLNESEAIADTAALPPNLVANLDLLGRALGLSDADRLILGFVVVLHSDRALEIVADELGRVKISQVAATLAQILKYPEDALQESLSARGVLIGSGLLAEVRNAFPGVDLSTFLQPVSKRFVQCMLASGVGVEAMLSDAVTAADPPTLALGDYRHVAEKLAILRPYLRHAVESRRGGVNILIHGAPGTGKSELARLLAADIQCPLYQVASETDDGMPIGPEKRMRALRAAQALFAKRPTLLVFDEVEDVFRGEGLDDRKGAAQVRKAWMTRLLERNPVPTLWLSNQVWFFDPALLRRFDMILELGIPTRRQRERIVKAAFGDLVSPDMAGRLAANDHLAPAVVTRAASVVHALRDRLPADTVSDAVGHLIDGTLLAQGHPGLHARSAERLPATYDPRFVNVDADLERLADGLCQSRSGRLCLYGPPGTGKSAFGRWLAERLDAPLHAKTVSDIVSPWLGMTEKNLARAFRDAERDGAVLMIDEVDSFLQDRRKAQRPWEITEVNELLTQMESFGGVFIASTNLMDNLDQASLRRFDLKLRFGYLRAEQAWELLFRHAAQFGIPLEGTTGQRTALARLGNLTPGDFAAVARQHRFKPILDSAALVAALAAECAAKEGSVAGPIGFV